MLVGPFAYPVTGIWEEGSRPQSLRYVDQFSASPVDLIYPNVMQPFWGERLLAVYPQVPEKMLYLGVVPLLLALYSLRRGTRRLQRAFAWLGAVFAVLAMGTSLHSPNGTLYFPVPAAIERLFTAGMGWLTTRLALNRIPSYSLRAASAVYLPLPTLLLYLFLPMFSAMRVWSRFGLLAVFGVAVLSGYGLRQLLENGRASRLTAASKVAFLAGVLAISLADFAVFPYAMGWSTISGRTVDAWLADQAGEFAVMELPLGAAMSGRTLYSSRLHGKPIAFGYGTFFPRSFEEQRGVLDHFPEERGVDLLRSWQVRYVLVHPDFYGEAWTAVERSLRASPSLRLHGVWQSASPFEGDRVLRHLPGTESAFFDERVLVFEVL